MHAKPLPVVLCWHMHQPEYRNLATGEYQQPWTYLHAIKDYCDMASYLEQTPGAKAVVNFAPILLEQLDDYKHQIDDFLSEGTPLRDPLLAALVGPMPPEAKQRQMLIKHCLRSHERQITRFEPYRRLVSLAQRIGNGSEDLGYLGDQYLIDLIVWYHLAWLGESVRGTKTEAGRLAAKGKDFNHQDRCGLLRFIGQIVSEIIPRYRRLAEQGNVELAMSPYAHPILPLLLELGSAQEAMPDAPMPAAQSYPGGEERSVWQLTQGIALFRRHFGREPLGCWPSEGALSDASVRLFERFGFAWTASGGSVLRHSLQAGQRDFDASHGRWLFKPYQLEQCDTVMFFRDDALSDLIGFNYATWHADDAVANFMFHLENIADHPQRVEQDLVPIILDGENAWQHYPENGRYFLSALYKKLAAHPRLRLTTFSEYLAQQRAGDGAEAKPLAHLVPGSWVYGTLSTWIGSRDKNRGWDMLAAAKLLADKVLASDSLTSEKKESIARQLAVCEGSDWFWWFGDYNPAETVSDFEWLFRLHLANLYRLLGHEPPHQVTKVLSRGTTAAVPEGSMRPSKEA